MITGSEYPPENNPLSSHSDCLFYTGRACIELITLDEEKPCEECIFYEWWWRDKKKELQARWLREGIELMEKLRSGELIV